MHMVTELEGQNRVTYSINSLFGSLHKYLTNTQPNIHT